MKKSNIIIKLLVLLLALLMAGCSSKTDNTISFIPFSSADTQDDNMDITLENDKYRLEWKNQEKQILLYDLSYDTVYSTSPIDKNRDELNTQLLSDVIVEYIDYENNVVTSIGSYDGAVMSGRVLCKKTETGFKINYCFDNEEIAIPVEYKLTDKGLSISLNPSEICEGKMGVYRVSLAPYLCAINNKSDDSYLFVPSGSGALIYPDNTSLANQTYSQDVYGSDPTVETTYSAASEQTVKLPVYGMKNGNIGVCSIITKNEEAASIEAIKGASYFGYSTVYATFQIRGYSSIRSVMFGKTEFNDIYSDSPIEGICQVDVYPLVGENADYSGIAQTFKNVSFDNDNEKQGEAELGLIIYGGIMSKESTFGIPYDSLFSTTTLKQSEKIIKDISSNTDLSLSVMLKGFGETGLDKGDIGGGFTVNKNLGKLSDLFEINSYCEKNNIDLFFDFDLVCRKSSAWFDFKDTAKTLNNQTAYQYPYDKALRSQIEDSRYVLVSRDSLFKNVKQLLEETKKWKISGISLETIGEIAYSDNANNTYAVKGKMSENVSDVLSDISKSGKKISVSNANYYAAKCSSMIFETPSCSNRNDIFSVDIPFYQMVFKGNTKISSTAVNLSSDEKEEFLRAIESGTGITYAIYHTYDTKLTDSYYPVFNTGVYDAIKDKIFNSSNELSSYYKAIRGATILKHNILTNGVRQTIYDNGVNVYVNYSNSEQVTTAGTVPAKGYIFRIED